MRAFNVVSGKVLPLDRANVDTDAIIPKQYLKSIRKTGFGPFLFDDWRYLDAGTLDIDPVTRRPNPEFVLNRPEHAGARILVAQENFGCGSSREHAVWALDGAGFRCVIAPSYADIFFSNCFKNGMLPVVLKQAEVSAILETVRRDPAVQVTVDLPAQQVRLPSGETYGFQIEAGRKRDLIEGLDEIGVTLQKADSIRAYESRRRESAPWLFQ
ncbi:3-isopropylmalate dehydratase small subunit [Algiphilus sp. W345]|uniref:3-isopropylmalate dehydratase small subunit n=1 Tax=Banduia mediterranea TaxID=3075609 RepID=A0ABU2WNT9_9GAMM|nr:3-isopropylmalate dehydratase small subunit [Algiphilus sp. W345]MDT0498909.1 3-isopropylmalate dehydratase small subunit [Algiphilus sp. W345]